MRGGIRGRDGVRSLNHPCQSLFINVQSTIITDMKLDSKYFDRIRVRRKGERPAEASAPECQWDGCSKPGAHRAPVGRDAEGQYFLFCFEHARDYNKGYNYFSGLSDGEIARYQKEALTGHRPTWKMGVNRSAESGPTQSTAKSGSASAHARMRDPHGFFNGPKGARSVRARKVKSLESKAFDTLGLAANATSAEIKSRYKDLVKKHHPDANGGDRGSEDRFRAVIQAYQLLKQSGFC